ncbi:hypothetical protein [uncultured Sphingomonas sp.]|uniref:hypothetical protein n=1 Tax=uncultured Sphingomonas sp. TaxID=158754 RepID=UPI0025EE8E7D|nr:hypothetical protein [uncultured Sphingomonas sp.]
MREPTYQTRRFVAATKEFSTASRSTLNEAHREATSIYTYELAEAFTKAIE